MTSGSKVVFLIFGLIDPKTRRVFHVGCTQNLDQLEKLPQAVVARVSEIAPAAPHIVILRAVDAHPQIEWVKWSKRFRRDIVTTDWERYASIADAFTNSYRAKRILGEEVLSASTHQRRFHEFDRRNPDVFEEMLRLASNYRADGREISSIDVVVNDIRFEGPNTNRTDQFKISNTHRAFYARKLQMVDPSLCGLFAMRESIADELVLDDGRSWRDFARDYSSDIRFAGPEGTEEENTQWTY